MSESARGLSARWKLTLSYAAFLMLAGVALLAVVWQFLLRYVPDRQIDVSGGFVPNRSDLLKAFLPPTILALVLLLAFGLFGGWMLAGYMLSPLRRITAATRIAATGSLSHRIGMSNRKDEFGELANAFDAMLATLESHVAEQQRFAANASHELRTPLAIMRTVIDVAEKDPHRDLTVDLARLKETNARAIEMTEALLLLSRAGNTITVFEQLDLSLLAEDAVENMLSLAEHHGIAIEIDAAEANIRGSSALLQQMITNLIHNAIVHNHPHEGRIWVRTEQSHDAAVVIVENTGSEISAAQVGRFPEPFLRGTGRTRLDAQPGNGLGLSIVKRVVDAHGGRLELMPRHAGGIRVRVTLPRAVGR